MTTTEPTELFEKNLRTPESAPPSWKTPLCAGAGFAMLGGILVFIFTANDSVLLSSGLTLTTLVFLLFFCVGIFFWIHIKKAAARKKRSVYEIEFLISAHPFLLLFPVVGWFFYATTNGYIMKARGAVGYQKSLEWIRKARMEAGVPNTALKFLEQSCSYIRDSHELDREIIAVLEDILAIQRRRLIDLAKHATLMWYEKCAIHAYQQKNTDELLSHIERDHVVLPDKSITRDSAEEWRKTRERCWRMYVEFEEVFGDMPISDVASLWQSIEKYFHKSQHNHQHSYAPT